MHISPENRCSSHWHTINANRNSFIYVDVSCTPNGAHNVGSGQTNRQTRALATYFEREGIPASRVVLPSSDAEYASHDIDRQGHTLIVVQVDVTNVQVDVTNGLD